jgi:hypothetical protein
MEPQSSELVGRDPEIKEIEDAIQQLASGQYIKDRLFNLFGITGIGKTHLLKYVYTQHTSSHASDGIHTIFIDLSGFPTDKSLHEQQQYFLDMLLSAFQPERSGSLLTSSSVEESTTDIVRSLSELQHPVLLLIDTLWGSVANLGDVFDDFVKWFEEQLLLPLIRQVRFVAVLSSRKPVLLHKFAVRRRKVEIGLEPLTLAATTEQVQMEMGITDSALGERIFALTGGYPQATHTIVEALQETDDPPLQYLEERESLFVSKIVSMLEQVILQRLNTDEPFACLFQILALFREFETHTLRFLIEHDRLQEFLPNLNEHGLYSLFSELQRTDVISWSTHINAYQIDPTVRHLFAQYVYHQNPVLYHDVHVVAIEYYAALIDDAPMQRTTYLLEWLYHNLCLDNATNFEYSRAKQGLRKLIEKHADGSSTRVLFPQSLVDVMRTLDTDADIEAQLIRLGTTIQAFVAFMAGELSSHGIAADRDLHSVATPVTTQAGHYGKNDRDTSPNIDPDKSSEYS